ncbi:diacylglycerol/lipid kinase family protein [Mesonia maritima]|uniref:YegS/Rv2252/BmrU family lipid kinase n=1 Tax=Mesonia maritima TaxID=1793873 RepID=A0ABU1K740_9FLAO|nr:YegS/Rv2252/BmrU family lipid kinase [Mesonia maritima]MDR6300837.1 YegS/Rv2252/BmrU family lipid kinase [Mesonia maritima]
MEIFIVINPVSGDENKAELLKAVKKQLTENDSLDIFKTTGENDAEKINEKLSAKKYDRVLIAGGDGTIKLVAEAMGENKISIGILPAGSANGLAKDLNLPEEAEDFIKAALGKEIREIDAIKINGELSLHISDFGLNAELIKEFEGSNFRGKLGYALNSIPTLFQNKGPFDFTIETGKETLERKAIMVAFANSKKFGTGAIVNPDGKMDDGVFEVLIFKKFDIIEILKTMNEGAKLSSDFVEIISVKKANVKAKKPIAFQIDGEFCQEIEEATAEILPKKLAIAVG